MKATPARDGLADGEDWWAEEGADEFPNAGAEALHPEPGERDTRQKTADHLANLFRTSKEEADRVASGHEERVRVALEQGKSGQVRPPRKWSPACPGSDATESVDTFGSLHSELQLDARVRVVIDDRPSE